MVKDREAHITNLDEAIEKYPHVFGFNSFVNIRYKQDKNNPNYMAFYEIDHYDDNLKLVEGRQLDNKIYSDHGLGYNVKFIGHDALKCNNIINRDQGRGNIVNINTGTTTYHNMPAVLDLTKCIPGYKPKENIIQQSVVTQPQQNQTINSVVAQQQNLINKLYISSDSGKILGVGNQKNDNNYVSPELMRSQIFIPNKKQNTNTFPPQTVSQTVMEQRINKQIASQKLQMSPQVIDEAYIVPQTVIKQQINKQNALQKLQQSQKLQQYRIQQPVIHATQVPSQIMNTNYQIIPNNQIQQQSVAQPATQVTYFPMQTADQTNLNQINSPQPVGFLKKTYDYDTSYCSKGDKSNSNSPLMVTNINNFIPGQIKYNNNLQSLQTYRDNQYNLSR